MNIGKTVRIIEKPDRVIRILPLPEPKPERVPIKVPVQPKEIPVER